VVIRGQRKPPLFSAVSAIYVNRCAERLSASEDGRCAILRNRQRAYAKSVRLESNDGDPRAVPVGNLQGQPGRVPVRGHPERVDIPGCSQSP
jgi:hypothetical protein